MKKKLLVIGDSFQCADSRYPNTHWTEFLDLYEIISYAQVGASNSMISYQLIQGLKHRPDAVFISATDPWRLTFDRPYGITDLPDDWQYLSSVQVGHLTQEQKLLSLQHMSLVSGKMVSYTGFFIVLGMILEICHRKLPFVYSLGLLEQHKETVKDLSILNELDRYLPHQLDTNLAKYPNPKCVEGYPWHHVDDLEWQTKFAREVENRLSI